MFHETFERTFVGTCCVAEEVTLDVIIIVAVVIIDVVGGGVGITGEIFPNSFKERFGLFGGIPILCCSCCSTGGIGGSGGAEEESYSGGMLW